MSVNVDIDMNTNPEHIRDIIPRTNLGKTTIGKNIRCPRCSGDAYIYVEDRRYRWRCVTCGSDDYLKTLAQTYAQQSH